jgi:hypothetical protein
MVETRGKAVGAVWTGRGGPRRTGGSLTQIRLLRAFVSRSTLSRPRPSGTDPLYPNTVVWNATRPGRSPMTMRRASFRTTETAMVSNLDATVSGSRSVEVRNGEGYLKGKCEDRGRIRGLPWSISTDVDR